MTSASPSTPSLSSNTSCTGAATAARIAAALNRPTRSIRRALAAIPSDSQVTVNGNLAAGWLFSSLPADMRKEMEAAAHRRGYASAEHLLKAPPTVWLPPLPLSQIAPSYVEEAGRLQKALIPTLQRLQENRLPISEIMDLALTDYRREFGHSVTLRHLNRLIKRTQDRDGGAENWGRLDIFLSDHHATTKTKALAVGNNLFWRPLFALVGGFADPTKPSANQLCLFWDQAFACLEARVKDGISEKRGRRELRQLLEEKMPFIRSRGRALETNIRRRLDRWREGDRTASALADQRAENSGRARAVVLPEAFRKKLLARAHALNGRVAQAWREARKEGWMPADVAAAYPLDWSSKSYVPNAIRQDLAADLKVLEPLEKGPHKAQMSGPSINRDYSEVPSGKIFQSDDITAPIWFYVTNPDGSFKMTRGQLLPWVCARSQFIVTAQLIPEKGYDSIDILRGITRLHDEYGLPEQLYFENGIWGTLLIDGSKGYQVPWHDFAYGLNSIGVRVRHALPRNPRAKIVENIGGQLQNRMNRLRGYAGRNPETCPEDTLRNLRLVETDKVHPSEFFYSQQEWMAGIERICDEFNHERQNGKMLAGLSPIQAFEKYRESPPIKLTSELRYLLARSRVETTVKASGIHVNRFTYKGEAASALVGQRVLAWFNAEDPESICITDLNHKNPFTLMRETSIPAFDATPEEFEQAQRENHAQTKYRRTLYATLKKDFSEEFLRARRQLVLAPAAAIQLGQEMNAQRAIVNVAAKKNDRLKTERDALARRVGLTAKTRQPIDESSVSGLRQLASAGIVAKNPHNYGEEDRS